MWLVNRGTFRVVTRRPRAGFTLLELVIVVMIIAAIAGLVIPQLSMIGRSTDMAMSYVAIFKVYASGKRASLVAVVDSYGRDPDYTQQQFNESLPDDSRRG